MIRPFLAILSVITLCGFKDPGTVKAPKLPAVVVPTFKKDTVSIVKFGAKPDGITLNTKSINDAISATSKKGGGVVLVPRGLWLTGPIELKSNVNLHLQRDAFLNFTGDFTQYKLIETNWEGLRAVRNQSPISATNAVNIAITGHGIVDGSGDKWRMVKKDKLSASAWKKLTESGGVVSDDKRIWYPSQSSYEGSKIKNSFALTPGKTVADYEHIKDFMRPNLLVLTKCKNILLDGVTFQNSAAWNLHPLMSENITIRNVLVKNPWYAQNGDGLDLESCKNVVVENSVLDVGDDALCIKSGRDAQGRERAMPTENVLIRNCIVYNAHGGFVVGSEMSGGAKNIIVENCSFIGTDIGIRFKTTRGRGGVVENIFINNINMKDIPGEAILFDMYYEGKDPIALAGERREPPKVDSKPVTEETPVFQNVYIKNVAVDGAEKGIFVRGLPEMNVKNIVMEDMVIQAKHGLEMTEGSGITIRNTNIITKETNPVLQVHNSKNIVLDNIRYNAGAETLLAVYGDKTTGVKLLNTDGSKAKNKTLFDFGAKPTVLTEK
ncbi:glycoside hydrolase family 28 protein [Aridibaculum aurantiacum]|uniref:glycoside hydrolase family 28 protein n=1 Tax=Aridibaculum aurantiacum TaxID=2810307 RepID=UPI001A971F15|nr:glycoside hydrolase family 28 protein [Aridibaculum aurantiacum]